MTEARRESTAPNNGEALDDSLSATLPRRQVVLTMAGVMLAIFLASLDQTIVSTAMPRIITDLGGLDRFTWVVTAYLVASTTAVPIVGKLSDIYGRKSFYIAGIAVFLTGSVLAGQSQTMNQLIAFRAVQGLGGGVMMAIALVSIADLFPPSERGKYQGMVAAVFGLSSIIGPTLGGFITDALSWHWIFYVNLPLGVPIIAVFIRWFPNIRPARSERHIDFIGMALLVLAVVPLLVGLSWGGVQYGWASPQVISALSVSAAAAVALIFVELRVADPIMPLSIYRDRVVSVSLLVIFLTGFGMFGAILFIPLFFQGVLGASATSSGSFLTPMMLGIVVGAASAGQALSRFGGHYRLQGLVAVSIMGAGMLLMSLMSPETSFARATLNIVVMGFGLGMTFPVYTIAVQNAVPHNIVGAATSATQFYRSIGGTLGLAILGSVLTNRFVAAIDEAIPESVTSAVSPEIIAGLKDNPQALINPEATAALEESLSRLGPDGAATAQRLLQALRESLGSAISDIFVVALAVLVLAFAATLLLRERPLRGRVAAPRQATPPAREAGDGD